MTLRQRMMLVAAAASLATVAAPRAEAGQARTMRKLISKKKTFRKLSPTLTRGEFDAKFQRALEAPANLVRSYAGVFWRLSRKSPPRKQLGGVGPAFGDAHHENFAFVRVGNKTIYAVSDFDDGGRAPVSEDAAHYFTELRLKFGKKVVRRAIEQYAAAVADPAAEVAIDPSLEPDWADTTKKDLERTIKGKKFRYAQNPDLRPARRADLGDIQAAVAADPRLSKLQIHDVAEMIRTQGGSAGLARYWLLVEPAGGGPRRTIELKEMGRPGVAESGVAQEMNAKKRLSSLKRTLWRSSVQSDWYPIDVGGVPYLVRDRHGVEKVDLTKLDSKGVLGVIRAQASYMASVHRKAWGSVPAAEIEQYLEERSATMAKAYSGAHEALSATHTKK